MEEQIVKDFLSGKITCEEFERQYYNNECLQNYLENRLKMVNQKVDNFLLPDANYPTFKSYIDWCELTSVHFKRSSIYDIIFFT